MFPRKCQRDDRTQLASCSSACHHLWQTGASGDMRLQNKGIKEDWFSSAFKRKLRLFLKSQTQESGLVSLFSYHWSSYFPLIGLLPWLIGHRISLTFYFSDQHVVSSPYWISHKLSSFKFRIYLIWSDVCFWSRLFLILSTNTMYQGSCTTMTFLNQVQFVGTKTAKGQLSDNQILFLSKIPCHLAPVFTYQVKFGDSLPCVESNFVAPGVSGIVCSPIDDAPPILTRISVT